MTSPSEAQQLLHQGRVGDAERAFSAILEKDPDNVQSLNVLSLAAMRDGENDKALELIQRAAEANPKDPLTLHNRGRILEGSGRYVEAINSQLAALNIAPHFHAARLFLGRSRELAGQSHQATVAYARALRDAQNEGRWLSQATTPPAFRTVVEHAVLQVRRGRRESIERLLDPIRAKYGRESMARIEKSLRIYLNEEASHVADPRQRSTFFHFPDIPAEPYINRGLFGWIDRIESMSHNICDELFALLPDSQGRESVFGSVELEKSHLRGLDQAPTWNGYYFYRHGARRAENSVRCPTTVALLDSLPLCRIRDHGPEVLFSVFTPGTHLLPHRGVTNTRVVAHLPLIVPADCALVVGGEIHIWERGKIVVFDDTYEHEAWNRSKQIRVVLIFDLWNPHIREDEKLGLASLIEDISDFRHEVESTD